MKFQRYQPLHSTTGHIDMAPLVDVIFQLLLFFMLSSSFSLQTGIPVRLPKAITSETIQEQNINITITGENVLYLNGKVQTVSEVKKYFQQANQKSLPVIIKSDRRASMGRIVEIWDLCRELGMERVSIATYEDQI